MSDYRFNEDALREIALRFPGYDDFSEGLPSSATIALDDKNVVGGYRYITLAESHDTYEALEMVPFMRTEMTDPVCIRHMIVSARGWATPLVWDEESVGIHERVRCNLLLFVGRELTLASALRLEHDPDRVIIEIGASAGQLADKAKLAFATYLMSEA